MSELEFCLLDVFTDRPYGGNPLAVFPEAPDLSPGEMQAIARELNFSEIVFVRPPSHASSLRRLRIFTPTMELPFAGRPTVGTAQLLVELGVAPPLDEGAVRFVLEEEVGPIPVEVIAPERVVPCAWVARQSVSGAAGCACGRRRWMPGRAHRGPGRPRPKRL